MQCAPNSGDRLENLFLWLDDKDRTPGEHMACDELLLSTDQPVLRAYRWSSDAVSVGVMASARATRRFSGSRPWVRRWTGGGIVEHGLDLTLALAVPSVWAPAKRNASAWYCWMHRAALRALASTFPEVRLADPSEFDAGSQCFQSPVDADILLGPQKVLGGALRIHRTGVLYQGSLQHISAPDGFPRTLAEILANQITPWKPPGEFFVAACELAEEKYDSIDWINRHL